MRKYAITSDFNDEDEPLDFTDADSPIQALNNFTMTYAEEFGDIGYDADHIEIHDGALSIHYASGETEILTAVAV